MTADPARIELWWLPLGAGGWFVRLNGRLYEVVRAWLERRRPLDLYHSALVVSLPEGRFVVENCWPIPDGDGARVRGVAVEGPVGSERIARFRVFRYEVRCWRDGTIADAGAAVASPQVLSRDPARARRLLGLVGSLPSPVWGRDELGAGEMWNSNSVIAWLLARAGLPAGAVRPPAGGRAPGWAAGVVVAGLPDRRPVLGDPGARGLGLCNASGGDATAASAWLAEAPARSIRVVDRYQWVRAYVLGTMAGFALWPRPGCWPPGSTTRPSLPCSAASGRAPEPHPASQP